MELFQKLAERYPRLPEAHIKWALCWECTGNLNRAEKVLVDARQFYQDQGWTAEAAVIQQELDQIAGEAAALAASLAKQQEQAPSQAAPNLMFRREFKWKGKKP